MVRTEKEGQMKRETAKDDISDEANVVGYKNRKPGRSDQECLCDGQTSPRRPPPHVMALERRI